MKAYQKDYVNIKPLSNKVLDYSKTLKKEIVFRAGVNPFSYLYLILKDTTTKYSVNVEEILMLFYLNELGVFPHEIQLDPEKRTYVDRFVNRGLIERDYTIKERDLYKLSETGFKIILDVLDAINDADKFLLYNREMTLDVHTKAKKVIRNIKL